MRHVVAPDTGLALDRSYRIARDGVLDGERYGAVPTSEAHTFLAAGEIAGAAIDGIARQSVQRLERQLTFELTVKRTVCVAILAAIVLLMLASAAAIVLGRRALVRHWQQAAPVRPVAAPRLRAFVVIEGGRRA